MGRRFGHLQATQTGTGFAPVWEETRVVFTQIRLPSNSTGSPDHKRLRISSESSREKDLSKGSMISPENELSSFQIVVAEADADDEAALREPVERRDLPGEHPWTAADQRS